MSLSRICLVALTATMAMGCLAAHADTLTVGNSVGGFDFKFNGQNYNDVGGGNYVGSSAVIGGQHVTFDAVYCVDLYDSIGKGTYTTTFSTKGSVFGSTINNDAAIAWLILNTDVTTTSQSEGLQAAIWEEEYGNKFSLDGGQSSISNAENADLGALSSAISHGQVTSGLVGELEWMSPTTTEGSGRWAQTTDNQGLVGLVHDPTPSPVPEPGTLSLFGTGVLGLAGMVRRRLSSAA